MSSTYGARRAQKMNVDETAELENAEEENKEQREVSQTIHLFKLSPSRIFAQLGELA